MAKDNIINQSLRLNLRNEQHVRIHNVLKDLNPSIHKSANQFMVNALDFYIRSFEDDDLTNEAAQRRQVTNAFVTREDLEKFRVEMQSEMKEEIIRILGAVFIGGQAIRMPTVKPEENTEKAEEDSLMADLVSKWG